MVVNLLVIRQVGLFLPVQRVRVVPFRSSRGSLIDQRARGERGVVGIPVVVIIDPELRFQLQVLR